MEIKGKEKSVIMAREIKEAMETLDVALDDHADEREVIEAKNIVANVLRSYKTFLDGLSPSEQDEAQKLFHKKIDAMAIKAKKLTEQSTVH